MTDVEAMGRKLTCTEACILLGCRKSHFYNLVKTGVLPAHRHGKLRGIWVYERDCEEYLNTRAAKNCVMDR